MTGLLNDVMHDRADTLGAPDLDLDAIIVDGARRVRRRRVVTGLGAAAVAATVAVGGLAVPSLLRNVGDLGPAAPAFERGPAWALGSKVHVGTRVVDVGREVASFVQTDDGIVFTSPDSRVRLWDGARAETIGKAEGQRLRADDTGSLVAWVELAEDGHPQYVVFDTAERSEVARVDDQAAGASLEPSDGGAQVFAVDDGAAYWRHDADLVRYDVATGEETVVSDEVGEIVDVAASRVAYIVDGRGNHRWGIAARDRVDPTAVSLAEASNGFLSPDGRLLTAEEYDSIAVYATESRQDVTPKVEGYRYVVGFGWSADDVVTVMGLTDYSDESATGDVLSCDVSDDECTVVSSFEGLSPEAVVLDVGDPVT
jgi:hypothetical protein